MVPVIHVSHLRSPKVKEVKSVAQGKARTYYLLQSHSESKAQALTYIANLPKLTVIPAALPLPLRPSVAQRGMDHPQKGTWPEQIHSLSPVHISLLTGTESVRCGPEGEGSSAHPQSPAAERAGTHAHPAPGAPATDWPPTHGGKSHMPEF